MNLFFCFVVFCLLPVIGCQSSVVWNLEFGILASTALSRHVVCKSFVRILKFDICLEFGALSFGACFGIWNFAIWYLFLCFLKFRRNRHHLKMRRPIEIHDQGLSQNIHGLQDGQEEAYRR